MNTDIATGHRASRHAARRAISRRRSASSRAPSRRRGAVQVLGGILLQAEEGRLTLAATDMEISLRASISRRDRRATPAVVVPGRLLTDLVRLLPDDSVTLAYEEGDGVLAVTSGQPFVAAERLQRRGLPAPSATRRPAAADRRGRAPRDDREGRPRRVTGRVAAGAHGRPRPLRGRQARSWPRPTRTDSR